MVTNSHDYAYCHLLTKLTLLLILLCHSPSLNRFETYQRVQKEENSGRRKGRLTLCTGTCILLINSWVISFVIVLLYHLKFFQRINKLSDKLSDWLMASKFFRISFHILLNLVIMADQEDLITIQNS